MSSAVVLEMIDTSQGRPAGVFCRTTEWNPPLTCLASNDQRLPDPRIARAEESLLPPFPSDLWCLSRWTKNATCMPLERVRQYG